MMIQSTEMLEVHLRKILANGGEGVILHKVNSSYNSGRSNLLYKMKVILLSLSLLPPLSSPSPRSLHFKIKTATTIDEEVLVVKSTRTHIKLQLYV
jgi:hypothetical protein